VGKGDKRRPCSIGKEEKVIRDALMWGKITREKFDKEYEKLMDEGKITRSGQVVKREKT